MKHFFGLLFLIFLSITIFSFSNSADPSNNTAKAEGYNYFPNYHEQFNHEKKYLNRDFQNNRTIFSGYWGWGNQDNGKSDPFEGVKLLKQSEITNIDFNSVTALGGKSSKTPTPWGGGRGQNVANCFLDQIQEVKALGGSVTLCFGAAGITDQFFATSGDSNSVYLAYVKLHDLLLGYNINSVDFDLEGTTANYFSSDDNVTAMMWILKKIKADFSKINENFHVRITDAGGPNTDSSLLKKLNTAVGSESWIYNDMSGTSINNNYNNSSDKSWLESAMSGELEEIHKIFGSTGVWQDDYFCYHHLGYTNNFHRRINGDITANAASAKWAKDKGLGLIGAWNILSDHKKDSKIDPNHYGSEYEQSDSHSFVNDVNDFDITNTLVSNSENYGFYKSKKNDENVKPDTVNNFHYYSKSQKDIILKWDYTKNATYYDVQELDKDGKKIKDIKVCKNTAGFYYVDEASHYKTVNSAIGDHTFAIIPIYVTSSGKDVSGNTTKLGKITVSEKDISADVQYFDSNIFYPSNEFNFSNSKNDAPATSKNDHSKPDNKDVNIFHPKVYTTPAVLYIYYHGKIYDDIDHSDWGFGICKDFWNQKDEHNTTPKYLYKYNPKNGAMTANFESQPTPADNDSSQHWFLDKQSDDLVKKLTTEQKNDLNNFTYEKNSFLNSDKNYSWNVINTKIGGDTSKLLSPGNYQWELEPTAGKKSNNQNNLIVVIIDIVVSVVGITIISIGSFLFWKKNKKTKAIKK